MVKLQVGQQYNTLGSGVVQIVDDLGSGRKRFVGVLLSQPDSKITYFRNGSYANKAPHPHNITGPAGEHVTITSQN